MDPDAGASCFLGEMRWRLIVSTSYSHPRDAFASRDSHPQYNLQTHTSQRTVGKREKLRERTNVLGGTFRLQLLELKLHSCHSS